MLSVLSYGEAAGSVGFVALPAAAALRLRVAAESVNGQPVDRRMVIPTEALVTAGGSA